MSHFVACCALLTASLACLPAYATDILEAYQLAQGSDPVFESARYALESAQEKIPQARARLLPVANIVGNKGTTSAETNFTGATTVNRDMSSWTWNLQLTQPLLRVANVYAYRESGFIVKQAEAQYAKAEQDLVLRVADAYFGVIVAQEAIAAADAQVHALEEQLAQVEHGYALGAYAVTDIDETKSRLGLARSQQITAVNDLEGRRADLEKVTGQPLSQLAILGASVKLAQPEPMDVHAWINQARTDNPAVRAQAAALAAAQEDINRNWSDHLPTVDLVASYGSNYSSNSLTTPNDFSTRVTSSQVSVQVNIPLFAGGATASKVTEALANMKKARADVEATSRQAGTDAQQAFAGVMNGMSQVEALNMAIASGQNAVKGNRVGYRVGVRINLDVLNAEQQLYTAQRDLAKARYDTLLQGLKLKAAAGTLGEADLLGINALLKRPESVAEY